MKQLVTLLVAVLVLVGCNDRVVPPVDGPQSVSFDVIYPQPNAPGAYQAASGVRLITEEIVGDTITLATTRRFYAQFLTPSGVPVPTSVELNGIPLIRHRDTDTLRLGSTSNSTLFGVQTWRLTDAAGPASFQVQSLEEIDSVMPLMLPEQFFRADTSLTLSWRPPSAGGSSGVLITWRMSGVETYTTSVADLGRFTIPANVVARFAGESELILTRYRTEQSTFSGRPLYLTRIAQRNYRVTVL